MMKTNTPIKNRSRSERSLDVLTPEEYQRKTDQYYPQTLNAPSLSCQRTLCFARRWPRPRFNGVEVKKVELFFNYYAENCDTGLMLVDLYSEYGEPIEGLEDATLFFRYEKGFDPACLSDTEVDQIADYLMGVFDVERGRARRELRLQLSGRGGTCSIDELVVGVDGQSLCIQGAESVAWHVSAGTDFSPLVNWSKGWTSRKSATADIPAPGLHVFTCLGGEYLEDALWSLLEDGNGVLYRDERTEIRFESSELVKFTNNEPVSHYQRHCSFGRGERFKNAGADGFYMTVELVCLRTGYREPCRLLYLLGENITTFDYYLHKGAVKIQYLTATCEGLAFGGARRSIYDYLQKQRYYAHNKMDGFDLRWLTSSAGSGTVSRLMGQAQAEGSVRFTQVGNTVGFAHPISEVKVCN
jgi:hypothetical protein